MEVELIRRLVLVADRERAGLGAAAAGHAAILADVPRARLRLHGERVDRADIQALRGRALQARLLVEAAAPGVRLGDGHVHLDRRVIEDADPWNVGEPPFAVHERADDLAGEAADAEGR